MASSSLSTNPRLAAKRLLLRYQDRDLICLRALVAVTELTIIMPLFSHTPRNLRSPPAFRLTTVFHHRPFSVSPAQRVRQSGQSPEEFEKKKDEQVTKQEQGRGEWHESLASSSESRVKADQEKVKDHDEHIEKLQKETANAAQKEK